MTAPSLFLLDPLTAPRARSQLGRLRCKKLNALQIHQNSVQTWLWLPNICKSAASCCRKGVRRTGGIPARFSHTYTFVHTHTTQQVVLNSPSDRHTMLLSVSVDTCLCRLPLTCLYLCVSHLCECFHVSFFATSRLDIIQCISFCRVCVRKRLCKRVCVCLLIYVVCQWVFTQTVILPRMWAAIQRPRRRLLMN